MIGVIIIAVVFTGISALIAYTATRGGFGGLSKALQTTSKSGSRALNTGLVFVYVAFGIALPLVFILGNRANSDAKVAGIKLTAAEQVGRELFGEHCATCHTLAGDNAVGEVGPNFNKLHVTEAKVLHTLANGCLQNPTSAEVNQLCLGYGNMPADILEGRQATDVAKFLAAVSGRP